MKEKRYYEMYQEFYDESLNHHAERIKQYYKEKRSIGDGENETYNHIVTTIIYKEKTNLIISKQEFSKIRLTYDNRDSLTHPDFPNRIFEKLKPVFNEIDTDITFVAILKDLAEYHALSKLSSNFRHNHQIYRMMYELNDFSEFEVNEFYSPIQSNPLIKKLHKLCDKKKEVETKSEVETKKINNFNLNKRYEDSFINLYTELSKYIIDPQKTTIKDFKNVFTKNFYSHDSKIYFNCESKLATLFLDKVRNEKIFKNLTQTKMAKSKMFVSLDDNPFSQTSFSNNIRNSSDKDREIVDELIQIIIAPKLK